VSVVLLREWGWILSYDIIFSELWETPEVTTEQMAAWRDGAVVSRDVTSNFDAPLVELPRYVRDEFHGGFADSETPMLMMQGTWDPATRPGPAEAVHEGYTGEHQYWVSIDKGAHGAVGSVPTEDGTSCGVTLLFSFLDDPTSPPDTSCLDHVAPFTFDGNPALNGLLFGTEDAWGG
jgi:hypothetical protein